jgi:hypothetical protein
MGRSRTRWLQGYRNKLRRVGRGGKEIEKDKTVQRRKMKKNEETFLGVNKTLLVAHTMDCTCDTVPILNHKEA